MNRIALVAFCLPAALAACSVEEDTVVDPSPPNGGLDAGGRSDSTVSPRSDGAQGFDNGSAADRTSPPRNDGTIGGDGASAGGDARVGCGATELCNRLDDNCDGRVDEGCPCAIDTTQQCSTLDPGLPGRGACAWGTQRCEGTGEFGHWTECAGEVGPSPEVCNGMDDDCDGMVDENLTQRCYPGPMGTEGVGPCHDGSQQCVMGAWGMCTGAVTPVAEVCNDRVDNDCNGMTDECRPCIMTTGTSSPWQMNRAMGPVCFGRTFSTHGDPGEFALSVIPAETASGWTPVTASTIDFAQHSALCGRSCECLNGGEFTYFQTFFDLPAGFVVRSLAFTVTSVDDGAVVTIFNSRYPAGIVDPGSYIRLGAGGTSADLGRYLVPGRNRVVITHIDDCCSERSLGGVRIVLNGGALDTCPH